MTPRLALRILALALGGLCAVGLWRVLAGLGVQVPLDPNEGWNAYHSAAAMRGAALYPPHDAYLVNNYPPLSFYIVGAVGRLLGDFIFAGRLVSLAAVAFIAVAMTGISRSLGAPRGIAVFPALICVCGLAFFSDYIGMDDPQLLAQAFGLAGAWVLLAAPRTTRFLALAAGLFVISFFVKHNVVALPAACGLWLVLQDRKSAWRFAAFGIGFGLIGLVLFRLVYGVSLLSVVATARLYSFDQLFAALTAWLHWFALPLTGLGVLLYRDGRRREVQFCALYAVIAIALGIVFLGGAGVDVNAMFEADIALALCAGVLIASLPGYRGVAAAALYALPLLFNGATDKDWQAVYWRLQPFREEAVVAGKDIALLKQRQGPALCEMLSFCYWAGKAPTVDFFNVGQQFETGARSDAALSAEIDAKRFAVIQFDPGSDASLGENAHNAMARAYRIHHSDWYGTFYFPK
ncbi:MAG: hypothetical protein P4L57_00375 [Rhizomicrobium sp.]|nr:hypothetical protein [Rhizomicrobium sp.]